MGMMDRDYMRDDSRQRTFSPPPERSTASYLTIVCIVLAGLLVLYKGADWLLQQRAASLAAKQAQILPPADSVNPGRPAAQPLPTQSTQPADQSPGQQAPSTRNVTKCVIQGKTSYGDADCGQGAIATQVVTRSNHNLMDAVQAPVMTQPALPAQQAIVVQTNGGGASSLATQKAICKTLDEEVARLDALARQPQSAQTQDWISAERKKVRDAQYRLPCP